MNDVPLCCNQCWNKLDGKAFKTSCDHCFCEPCADATFGNRNRRCSCCNLEVTGVLEFQVVGTPILDDQLTDVRSTLQAIACANGACFLDSWISSLHRFERNQLAAWGNRQGLVSQDSLAQAEQREKELGDRELQARQMLISMEHENEQLRKEKENFQRGVTDLQSALEERTRQAENWRAMYEALKSGGRVSIPAPQQQQQQPQPQQQFGGSARKPLARSDDALHHQQQQQQQGSRVVFDTYRYNEDENRPRDRTSSNEQAYSRDYLPSNHQQQQQPDTTTTGGGRFNFSGRSESFAPSSSSSSSRMPPPPPSPSFSGFPARSSSLPPAMRPPTRDTLTSLLNRSVVPRTASSASTFRMPGGGNNNNNQDAPVRSSFFSSSSLRAVSPSMNSSSQHAPLLHPSSSRGRLSQGGMLH